MNPPSGSGPEKPVIVHNEQIKLAATALNNIGVASAVTGAIVPLVTHMSPGNPPSDGYWGWFVALWLGFGFGWHVLARLLLRGLR